MIRRLNYVSEKRLFKFTAAFLTAGCILTSYGSSLAYAYDENEKIVSTEYSVSGEEQITTTDKKGVYRLYVDSKLTQESHLDKETGVIRTTFYDDSKLSSDVLSDKNLMGYKNVVIQKEHTDKTLSDDVRATALQVHPTMVGLIDEPVDNSGLDPAGMQGYEGYYYLGNSTIWGYTGYLYRSFSEQLMDHVTHWFWTKDTAKTAIEAAASTGLAFAGAGTAATILGVIIAILRWEDLNTLRQDQTVKVDIWRNTYNYRVKVNGQNTFSTSRIEDYWWIKNQTTGEGRYQCKAFIDGFSPSNTEMIRAGVEALVNPNWPS